MPRSRRKRGKRGKRKAKAKDNEPPATQELVPAEPQLERRVDEFPVTNKLRFTLNGQLIEVENPDPQQLLVHWLRESGYTGTKFSCGQGGCGACTVNIRPWPKTPGDPPAKYVAVNGCLRPLAAVHEMDVLTVEGLGSCASKRLDPVQERIAMFNGSQCGWCTPGFVMGMNAYLDNKPKDERTLLDIENIFDGHLCRCTGFRPILCGMKTFAKDGNKEELKHTPRLLPDASVTYCTKKTVHPHITIVHDEPEAKEYDKPDMLVSKKGGAIWYGLSVLDQLWPLLKKYEDQREHVRIVTANTAYGIQPVQPIIEQQKIMLFIGHIPQLTELACDGKTIVARCSVPIQQLRDLVQSLSTAHVEDQRSSYPPTIAYNHWKRLATTEIRNVGSIAGNLYLARRCDFPSDLHIVLTTLGATVVIRGPSDEGQEYGMIDFVQKKGILDGSNIIYEVKIPIEPRRNVFIRTYKVAKRPQNSHSLVNSGFSVEVEMTAFREVCIVFGNIGENFLRMTATEEWMQENCTPADLARQLPELLTKLEEELRRTVVPKVAASEEFRVDTARNIFFKFLVEMARVFELPNWTNLSQLDSAPNSLINSRFTNTSSGRQDFCVYPYEFPVSEPIVRQSAFVQATGEAKYTQDIGRRDYYLSGVYILNVGEKAEPYAKFEITVPPDIEKRFPGVVRVFTAADMKDPHSKLTDGVYPRNNMGPGQFGFHGDTLFAQDEVLYIGQPIGMVVAKTQEIAREAAQWLQDNAITYTKLPGIVSFEEAIEKKNFLYDNTTHAGAPSRLRKISRPDSLTSIDWDTLEKDPDIVIAEGRQNTGYQYHFYMETQSAIAYPTEGGGIKVYASSQAPNPLHGQVSTATNLPLNKISIEITRLGGGYGGKCIQSKFVSSATAFCAQQLQQPVRVANYRVEDMHMIGKRHAYHGKFKVAATKEGIMKALQILFINDGGCTYDLTFAVMELGLLCSDSAYYVAQYLVQGECTMTTKVSNTAFRSFGVVQTMLIVEAAIEAMAERLNLPDDQFREKNFYQLDQYTPFGQKLHYCNIQGVWDTIKKVSDYEARKREVEEFNRKNRCKKRGIKMTPLKYGISLQVKSVNQGSAIIEAYYTDGTLLLSHGGVEMGQGLDTKMMQIAALELNVPMGLIRVTANSTDKIANAVSTSASTGSDLNGGAVKDACRKLRLALATLLTKLVQERGEEGHITEGRGEIRVARRGGEAEVTETEEDARSDCLRHWKKDRSWYKPGEAGYNCWPEVVQLAFDHRVSMISKGHYNVPGISEITEDHSQGRPFYYFNYAAAVSEVEIDTLTGESTILRSDIVYDAGHSLNPAIDIGQIEGAFVQGIGYVTTEEIVYDENGRLLTDGTWEYKPPCSKCIPKDFRVTIYPGTQHEKHSRPLDRICHITSETDNHVIIDPHGIQSSKTSGEPPLVLANSVFFAIKQAVAEARKEAGLTGRFTFDSPATVERIQQACAAKNCTMNCN